MRDEPELDELQSDVSNLRVEQIFTDSKIDRIRENVGDIRADLCSVKKSNEIFINAKDRGGFQVLDSSYGCFFVSVKDVHSQLDGHKIIFTIGNPSNVTFSNPKITLRWNRPLLDVVNLEGDDNEFDKTWKNWENSFKKKEFSIFKEFAGGHWTEIECFITPSDSKELECIEFSIEAKTVKLYESQQKG